MRDDELALLATEAAISATGPQGVALAAIIEVLRNLPWNKLGELFGNPQDPLIAPYLDVRMKEGVDTFTALAEAKGEYGTGSWFYGPLGPLPRVPMPKTSPAWRLYAVTRAKQEDYFNKNVRPASPFPSARVPTSFWIDLAKTITPAPPPPTQGIVAALRGFQFPTRAAATSIAAPSFTAMQTFVKAAPTSPAPSPLSDFSPPPEKAASKIAAVTGFVTSPLLTLLLQRLF